MTETQHLAYVPLDNIPNLSRARKFRVKYVNPFTFKNWLKDHNIPLDSLTIVTMCDKDIVYSNLRSAAICDLRDRYFLGCSLPTLNTLKRNYDPTKETKEDSRTYPCRIDL